MKNLLLIGLAISGLVLIPAQHSEAQTTVLVPRTEGLSFGFPSGYNAYPRYLNYYPYGYSGHPYVHYYPYAGNPYSYYSAPPTIGTADIGLTAIIVIIISAANKADCALSKLRVDWK